MRRRRVADFPARLSHRETIVNVIRRYMRRGDHRVAQWIIKQRSEKGEYTVRTWPCEFQRVARARAARRQLILINLPTLAENR